MGSNSETFFGRTVALPGDAVIDWLIKWVQLAPAVDHSPVLNRSCLRAWTQLTYFLSFSTSPVFLLQFAMSRIFYFAQCPKRQGMSVISEWPSYNQNVFLTEKLKKIEKPLINFYPCSKSEDGCQFKIMVKYSFFQIPLLLTSGKCHVAKEMFSILISVLNQERSAKRWRSE